MGGCLAGMQRERDVSRPWISVIMPVLHEAATINSALDHLLSLPGADGIEAVVVDGSPGGDTLQRIGRPGVIRVLSARGRGRQMNRGARLSAGGVLLFLHADTRLPRGGLMAISRAMADPRVDGGAFDLSIASRRPVYRVIEKAASWRSRVTRIPYGDQAIFIRRACFYALSGFRALPIMEDVDLMQRMKRRKKRLVFLDTPVRTSPRRWEAEGVLRGTLRNRLLMAAYGMGVPPHRLARFYPYRPSRAAGDRPATPEPRPDCLQEWCEKE